MAYIYTLKKSVIWPLSSLTINYENNFSIFASISLFGVLRIDWTGEKWDYKQSFRKLWSFDQGSNRLEITLWVIAYESWPMTHGYYSETSLPVSVNIDFEQVSAVSDTDMDYEATAYFRQMWKDPRLGKS